MYMMSAIICGAIALLHILYTAICGSRNKIRANNEITQDQLFAHMMNA